MYAVLYFILCLCTTYDDVMVFVLFPCHFLDLPNTARAPKRRRKPLFRAHFGNSSPSARNHGGLRNVSARSTP